MHSPGATALVAADDLTYDRDASRFARTDFLPTETRGSWGKTFFYLEISNNEGER